MFASRLVRKSAVPLVACGLSSCLPDPRPYDACVDEETYYNVAPKGCNGHRGTILAERLNKQTYFGPLSSGSGRRIAVDEEHIYWIAADGALLATPKEGGDTQVLLEGLSPYAPTVQLTDKSVYVVDVTEPTYAVAAKTLYAVDKTTGERSLVTTATGADNLQVKIHDGYYYANVANPVDCTVRGPLPDGEHKLESPSCYLSATLLDFAVNDAGVYGVDAAGNFVLYPADQGESVTIGSVATDLIELEIDDDYAYFTEHGAVQDYASTFARIQVSLAPNGGAGTLISEFGYHDAITNSGTTTFVVSPLVSDGYWSVSKLLAYTPGSIIPEVLAASLDTTFALTYDEAYLYVLVGDSVSDSNEQLQRSRLLQVER